MLATVVAFSLYAPTKDDANPSISKSELSKSPRLYA